MNSATRARLAQGGGRFHFGIPGRGVTAAEAFVRLASELMHDALDTSALDTRHRVIVAKTVLAQRNFALGWEHRTNRVAPHVQLRDNHRVIAALPLPRIYLELPPVASRIGDVDGEGLLASGHEGNWRVANRNF